MEVEIEGAGMKEIQDLGWVIWEVKLFDTER